MTDDTSTSESTAEAPPARPAGFEMRGTPINPGLGMGIVHRKDYDLSRADMRRVPLDQIEGELNRFHASLRASKDQLESLKRTLGGRVPPEHVQILHTHITYLRDSVFLSDVENLILNEQMSLEGAIAKVIADFDRIFRLVENELLRERAVDLRDVGIRVLRNLEPHEREGAVEPPADYVLVARELSIVDMFRLDGKAVLGIVTEEGGLTSHAAILARSMGVPTVTGLEGLRERVQEGDFVILDATEGVLRVNPEDVVREQYRETRADRERARGEQRAFSEESFRTEDGVPIHIRASCGNLPEVERAMEQGVLGIGLYRTELLYLVDRQQPSLESLIAHYSAVLDEADGQSVTFRLLDVSSSWEVNYLHETREPNPALGRVGIRALLECGIVLRRQLEALLRVAVEGTNVRIAVPFVTDVSELRGLKEALFDVRMELQRSGHRLSDSIEVGAVIETPAAALGVESLIAESDFLCLSVDALAQYVLAADRENHAMESRLETLHPTVLRLVCDVVRAAERAGCQLQVLGEQALGPAVLPLLVGAGVTRLCVPPLALGDVERILASVDSTRAVEACERVAAAGCAADTLPIVDSFVRAYDRLSEAVEDRS
jgi:phosphotransferase system enzyme I (PtsI)